MTKRFCARGADLLPNFDNVQMAEEIVETREQNAISDRSEVELHPTFRNFFEQLSLLCSPSVILTSDTSIRTSSLSAKPPRVVFPYQYLLLLHHARPPSQS
jgi:hypothetical protein